MVWPGKRFGPSENDAQIARISQTEIGERMIQNCGKLHGDYGKKDMEPLKDKTK